MVRDAASFYVLRFLLGIAEAGFFPGMTYYLTQWFPQAYLSRNIAGTDPGKGITTIPGGFALYKSGTQVGGIGIAGIAPEVAELVGKLAAGPDALTPCAARALRPR